MCKGPLENGKQTNIMPVHSTACFNVQRAGKQCLQVHALVGVTIPGTCAAGTL